jgi:uncharacterized protein (TIGR02453 family)
MPQPDLITDARAFLTELSANNTRDWFQAHKARYDDALKAPALALLDALAPKVADLAEGTVTTKLFRPHRDVRFSKDKTPYNTHLHMMWQADIGGRQQVVFFFGIAPDYVTAGAGLMSFDPPVLADWRKMVDLDGPRIDRIVQSVESKGYELWGEALKRVPPPFPKDHPQARLLQRKGLVLSGPLPGSGPLETRLTAAFTDLAPVTSMLSGWV